MSREQAERTASWTRYWSRGRIAACSGDEDGNYFPEIKRRWTGFFNLLNDGDAILDVATGNGAVLALALNYAERLKIQFSLFGVDRANPVDTGLADKAAALGCILQLQGDTPAEALPFEDARFHAVTSQYALEYTDLSRSVPEIARVLQAGGELMLITHTRESDIMDQTRIELDDGDFVLSPDGVLDCFEQLVRTESRTGAAAPATEQPEHFPELKNQFSQAAAAVLDRLRDRNPVQARFLQGVMTSMGEVYQHRLQYPPETVLQKTAEVRTETLAHLDRLQDMHDAACGPEGLGQLRTLLRDSGLEIRTDEIVRQEDGAVLGHQLISVRL
jgi:ubiquinone/menaquinone biosynthesis C-methylase UbiE